jgi:Flp pilus assembly protein TadD
VDIVVRRGAGVNPEASIELAWRHIGAGRWDAARAVLTRVVHAAPADARAAAMLALVLESLGQLEGAEFYGRRAVSLDPDAFGHRLNLANVLTRSGALEEAVRLYRALAIE